MDLFSCFMDRLKSQVGLSKDREIAELIGLSITAFAERKRRDSIPIKDIFQLAKNRPELGLDPDWIVSGTSKVIGTTSADEASLLQCYQLMNAQNKNQLLQIALLWAGVLELKSTTQKGI